MAQDLIIERFRCLTSIKKNDRSQVHTHHTGSFARRDGKWVVVTFREETFLAESDVFKGVLEGMGHSYVDVKEEQCSSFTEAQEKFGAYYTLARDLAYNTLDLE